MADGQFEVLCTSCGTVLSDSPGLTEEDRLPCPSCGSTGRTVRATFRETIELEVGLRAEGRSPEGGRPFVELRAEPSVERRTGRKVEHERLIDRRGDHYIERVTDSATGEVLHECDEPLSEHRGHGDARRRAEEPDA